MSKKVRFRIAPDGKAHGVYSDILQRMKGARLQVRRFSHVEFDEASQCWVARAAFAFKNHKKGEALCSSPTRSECLALEHNCVSEFVRGIDL